MAVSLKKGVYIVAGKRTPFGKFGGVFRGTYPEDLLATAAAAAFAASNVHPATVDSVNIGQICVVTPSALSPRHAALKAGVPANKPVLGLNKLSGSSIQAVINSAQEILLGSAHVSMAGGMDCLSTAPYLVRNIRFSSLANRTTIFEDMIQTASFDSYIGKNLLETVDSVARSYGISREEADKFAVRSHKRWSLAYKNGDFHEELAPVFVKDNEKEILVTRDENPKLDADLNLMSELMPVYPNGICTAGNCCGLNDGAGAIILSSEEALKEHNLVPLARVAGWACVGAPPETFGMALVPAVRALLDATGRQHKEIDLLELHETFAPSALACASELGFDQERVNLAGNAICIGHAPGASGARLTAHLTHQLRRRREKHGIAAMSLAGGQGIAILLESISTISTPRQRWRAPGS